MATFEQNLEKYAQLVVRQGINIQQGQDLIIRTDVEAAPLIPVIAKAAYEAGARNVHAEYSDAQLDLVRYLHAPDDAFEHFPEYLARNYGENAENNAAFLNVYAPHPDLFETADPARVAAWQKAAAVAFHPYAHYGLKGIVSWSIVAVPTQAWAQRLFPDLSVEAAVERLWDLIFSVTRIHEADPVAAWQAHADKLTARAAWLDGLGLRTLHYTGPGTDLYIDLPAVHHWMFARFENAKGIHYIPNMPTEEVFTTPSRTGVRGVVRNSKPLNYGGVLIDNFSLTFEEGQVVDFTAEKGYEALKNLLDTDEGARRLGEVALVPDESPISQSNVTFLNTLFDENASCHLALGRCVGVTVKGGIDMEDEDFIANDCNTSLTHVDFMVGSAQLNIDGITESGETIPIFRNGNWAG